MPSSELTVGQDGSRHGRQYTHRLQTKSPCKIISLLCPGSMFVGTQVVPNNYEDAWMVQVSIQSVDFKHGYICGLMEASNLPTAAPRVVTFWEGEIINNVNYYFLTSKWEASRSKDLDHWSKFRAFSSFKDDFILNGGRTIDLESCRFIFMRWKEQFFCDTDGDKREGDAYYSARASLSIAGFYYICLDTRDGVIEGYYFDPNSSPFQKLSLQTESIGHAGHGFATYSLH